MLDPTLPMDAPALPFSAPADLQRLLQTQLQIADTLQRLIIRDQASLSPRELKDLAASASSLISLSHRTETTLNEIATYRLFLDAILEFLRRRSDSLGVDLMAELQRVAQELRAEHAYTEAIRLVAQDDAT